MWYCDTVLVYRVAFNCDSMTNTPPPPGQPPPGQNPQTKPPDKTHRWTNPPPPVDKTPLDKPPPQIKSPGQILPGQNPPDNTPRTKPPWTKPPDNPPPRTKSPDNPPPRTISPRQTPQTKPPTRTKPPTKHPNTNHHSKTTQNKPQIPNKTPRGQKPGKIQDGVHFLVSWLQSSMMNGMLYVYIQLQIRYLIASGSSYRWRSCLRGLHDRVRRLATDQVVKGSSPATRHIHYALLINSQTMLNLL